MIKKLNARVDWLIAQSPVFRPADEDGASATIAFGADDFRADEAEIVSQEITERSERALAAHLMALPVNVEDDMVAGRHLATGQW